MELPKHIKEHAALGVGEIRGTCIRSYGYTPHQIIPDGLGNQPTLVTFDDLYDNALFDTDNGADLVNSRINIPTWATWVWVTAHLAWSPQTNGNTVARLHLWRDGSQTNEDLFYHNVVAYPTTANGGTPYISQWGSTGGYVPVVTPGEYWDLRCWQNSGGNVDLDKGLDCWLIAYYK